MKRKWKCVRSKQEHVSKRKRKKNDHILLIVNRNETYSHTRAQTFHYYGRKQCLGRIYLDCSRWTRAVAQFFSDNISRPFKTIFDMYVFAWTCGQTITFTMPRMRRETSFVLHFPSVEMDLWTRAFGENKKRTNPIHCLLFRHELKRKRNQTNKQTSTKTYTFALFLVLEWQVYLPILFMKWKNKWQYKSELIHFFVETKMPMHLQSNANECQWELSWLG